MKDIIVNWVKEDEELLEPYEWDEDDDLEIISRVDIYHVDKSLVLTEDEDFKFDYIAEHYGHKESECTYMISNTLTINLHN